MALFMDGVKVPQGKSHFEEAVYFLPLSSQKFLALILSTLWLSKPFIGFVDGNWELGIQCLSKNNVKKAIFLQNCSL